MTWSRGRPEESGVVSPIRGRRSGRRPGQSETRADILRAAQKLFAQTGYGGTSVRAIAKEAGVDAALIHHFFATKERLFAAAIEDIMRLPELVDRVLGEEPREGEEGLGPRLVRAFLELWTNFSTREPMLAVIRSAVTHQDAARLLGEFVSTQVYSRVVAAMGTPDAELRATLVGSQLVGMAMIRYAIKVEPLASADAEVIVRCLGPTIDRYLTGDLGPAV